VGSEEEIPYCEESYGHHTEMGQGVENEEGVQEDCSGKFHHSETLEELSGDQTGQGAVSWGEKSSGRYSGLVEDGGGQETVQEHAG